MAETVYMGYQGPLNVIPGVSLTLSINVNDPSLAQSVYAVKTAVDLYAASLTGLHLLAISQPSEINIQIVSNSGTPSSYSELLNTIFINLDDLKKLTPLAVAVKPLTPLDTY